MFGLRNEKIITFFYHVTLKLILSGVWWLSGRELDSRLRGSMFESHRRHCIVTLSKTLYPLLSTGSTLEDPSRHD